MKKMVVVGLLFLSVVVAFAQENPMSLIVGKWAIQGDVPARSIEFMENGQCFITMRDKSVNEYSYHFEEDARLFFLGTNGYYYEFKDDNTKFIMTPAFGEGGHIVTMVRTK